MTNIKVEYYHSIRDGMTHVDFYALNGDVSCWAGHLTMTKAQWNALGGALLIGSKESTACEILIEEAWRF